MARGLVYILTNPSLDGWVKIGKTDNEDIRERLATLNRSTEVPLSFRCYASYAVENPGDVEKRIHSILDMANYALRAREEQDNGRERVREFFRLSPETAYGIIREIAELRGDVENLKVYEPTRQEAREEAETSGRRPPTTFEMLNIPIGEKVQFQFMEEIEATVDGPVNQLEYDGLPYSVTGLAVKLLHEKCGWSTTSVDGWRFFTWKGIALTEWRKRLEMEEEELDESVQEEGQ